MAGRNKNFQDFLDVAQMLILSYAVGRVAHDPNTTWVATRNAIEQAAANGALNDISDKINVLLNNQPSTKPVTYGGNSPPSPVDLTTK